jgi:hypothetical protein
MEASKKPQLPLDVTGDGTVRVLEDRIVVEHLEIDDGRAARVVRDRAKAGQAPAATVAKSIEIGARVIDSEGTAANVDYVKAEFGRHTAELAEKLGSGIESGNELLAEEIAKAFGADRQGTVQHQIKEMLNSFSESQRESLVRQFSAKDGSNPLFDFKDAVVRVLKEAEQRRQREGEESRKRIDALTREIVELKERDEADRRVDEAEEAGTRKGHTFEEKVHEALERIASVRGDSASHTGGELAEGGGKKGDTLVELGAAEGPSGGRILFEAKDKKLSQNDAWRELNDGMAARAASFGVLVVAGDERVPARCAQLHEYEGNTMTVADDRQDPAGLAIEVAYRLAAARVTMTRDSGLEVDAAAVRDTTQEAVSTLKQAQAIRSTLTGIKTSSDKARAGLDALVETVRAKLERIETLVSEEAAKAAGETAKTESD